MDHSCLLLKEKYSLFGCICLLGDSPKTEGKKEKVQDGADTEEKTGEYGQVIETR